MPFLASRITDTAAKNFGMYEKAAGMADPNGELIRLELGRPIHDTPDHIKEATIAALRAGEVHYSDPSGLRPFRQALATKLRTFNALDVTADQIIVTNGLTQASFAAIMATIDPGDEVILLEPYYPQHVGKIEMAGGKVVLASLDAANNFSINPALIEEKITPKTKAIILVNPCNPTGRVYGREELQALADLAIRHDLLVITDEVYEYITFGRPHISIGALPGMAERTISLFAFTKAYAMDGWRVGYIVASPVLIAGILKVTMNEVTHVNTFIQHGALAATVDGAAALAAMGADDQVKRDLVVARLDAMAGVSCKAPEGSIYAFANIEGTGLSAQTFADRLLIEAKVVVEAGSFYGASGEGHIRVCFGSQTQARLGEAMDRIQAFVAGLDA
ncbi:MAG: aminotransferase class I/II-fold pyridoxal phosphate-dependent enzyme [Sphingobium sp.]